MADNISLGNDVPAPDVSNPAASHSRGRQQHRSRGQGGNRGRGGRGGRGGRDGNTHQTSRQIIDGDAPRRHYLSQAFRDTGIVIQPAIVDSLRHFFQYHRSNISPRVAFYVFLLAHDPNFKPLNLSNCSFLLTDKNSDYHLFTTEACQVSTIYHLLERRGLVAPYASNRRRNNQREDLTISFMNTGIN